MNLAAVVITDGRGELLERMWDSALDNIGGITKAKIMVGADDSGDEGYGAWLERTFPLIEWRHHPERQGLAAAIRTAWANLPLDNLDYILHLEDDLEFPKPIDLGAWMDPFRYEPMLAQVCLQRGPQAPTEIAAGGILRLYEQTHPIECKYVGGRSWTEQTKHQCAGRAGGTGGGVHRVIAPAGRMALPQATVAGCGRRATGCVSAGSGCAASQLATAFRSSGVSVRATCAMQSGAWARRWPLRQAPSCALR